MGVMPDLCVCRARTVPCFFGKVAKGTCYELSYESERCTYFVSHSWRDDGRRKVPAAQDAAPFNDPNLHACLGQPH